MGREKTNHWDDIEEAGMGRACGPDCLPEEEGWPLDEKAVVEKEKLLGRPLTDEETEAFRMGSKVQDVFRRVDIGGVVGAYLLTAHGPEDSDRHPIQERLRDLDRLILAICDTAAWISTCTPEEDDGSSTVFVTENEEADWDKRDNTVFNVEIIYDGEACLRLTCPEISWMPYLIPPGELTPERLAGMRLARPSEEEYGAEACCALILRELFASVREAEAKREYCEELDEEMSEYSDALEVGDFDAGVYRRDWTMDGCRTRDEREHLRRWREYKKSVRDIEDRHEEKVRAANKERLDAMIRAEYSRFVAAAQAYDD